MGDVSPHHIYCWSLVEFSTRSGEGDIWEGNTVTSAGEVVTLGYVKVDTSVIVPFMNVSMQKKVRMT